jgi:hypothetical protein
LEAVYIPKSVEILPYGELFDAHCTTLTVYCESISRPITWPSNWFDGRVVWGATNDFGSGDNDEEHYDGYATDVLNYEISNGSAWVKKCDATATKVRIYSTYDGRRVETIAQYAFENCYNLIDVIIPDSIYTIQQSAFKSCSNLEVIYIPKSVKYIESKVFYGCHNLTIYCEAESKPHNWSDSWLEGCSGNVVWGSERPPVIKDSDDAGTSNNTANSNDDIVYQVIGDYATVISCDKNVERVQILGMYDGYPVTHISDNAFSGCKQLVEVILTDNIVVVGTSAFANCEKLTKITWSSNLTEIGWEAFAYCTSLEEIIFKNGLKSISGGAFSGCAALKKVYIPASVSSIRQLAFSKCSNLTIYCEASQRPQAWHLLWFDGDVLWGVHKI